MKKIISLILAAIMVISMVACGGPTNDPKPTEPKDPVTNYVPSYPIVDEEITLTGIIVNRYPNKEGNHDRVVWDRVAEVTNIKVNWINLESVDALNTYLAGNEWPDLIHYTLDKATVNDYGVIGGRFVNWIEYLDIMPNLKKALEDYPAAAAKMTLLNGEAYGLPNMSGPSATGVVARPYVRLDILENAGITELPTTVEEFYQCLKTLKAYYNAPGLIMDKSVTSSWSPMLFAAFGTFNQIGFDDDGTGTVVHTYSSNQMKEYYKYMNKLFSEGLLHNEWQTLDGLAKNGLIHKVDSTIAFMSANSAQNLKADHLKDGNWDYLTCLAPLTSSFDSTQTLAGVMTVGGGNMYVNAGSEYVEEIMKMLDIAYATEEVVEGSGLYGQAFGYGPEGTGWWWNEDGTYGQSNGAEYGYDSYTALQQYELIHLSVGRTDAWGMNATTEIGNARSRQLGFMENVIPYQQTGNFFLLSNLTFTDDEQMILDQYLTEINKYTTEMYAGFINGIYDVDAEWNNYCKKLKDMGIDEVLEVYQAAYDRWNAAIDALG